MDSAITPRQRMQSEIESSLSDILSILEQEVSGPHVAIQAASLRDRFFLLTPRARQRAILDPRVVSRIEAIQRMVSELGSAALSSPEWIEMTSFLLRIELFCHLSSREEGLISVSSNGEDWISIPGTSLYIPAEHPAKEVRFSGGVITNKDLTDVRVGSDTSETKIGLAIPERAFNPPIGGRSPIELTVAERRGWSKAIEGALRLIRLDAPSIKLINEYTWFLLPLQTEQTGYFSSVSFNNLPNAIYMTLHSDLMFAETLVHESDHQWLYSYSRSGSLWTIPEHEQRAVYRSPWREDSRPLDGILRGASAFVRVGSFWTSLAYELPKDHSNHRWIRARAILSNFQAIDALRTTTECGDLSVLGERLVDELLRSARGTRNRLSTLSDFTQLLEGARAEQHEHDEHWAKGHPRLSDKCNKLLIEDYLSL